MFNLYRIMESQSFFLHEFFTGRVQGVGFRYQVVSIAKGFELTGYVKNLQDGRVELLAEGDETEVMNFIEAVESELDVFIKSIEKETGVSLRQHSNFSISG
jgi:acylphosphatase|tara:strand:+ start:179 stop:481 length:303 start_codon:yes stop_codon:yes gene_type:complete